VLSIVDQHMFVLVAVVMRLNNEIFDSYWTAFCILDEQHVSRIVFGKEVKRLGALDV
jgi:hypothetical protein